MGKSSRIDTFWDPSSQYNNIVKQFGNDFANNVWNPSKHRFFSHNFSRIYDDVQHGQTSSKNQTTEIQRALNSLRTECSARELINTLRTSRKSKPRGRLSTSRTIASVAPFARRKVVPETGKQDKATDGTATAAERVVNEELASVEKITSMLFCFEDRTKYDYDYVTQAYEYMSFFGYISSDASAEEKACLFPLVCHADYEKLGHTHRRLVMIPSGIIFADDDTVCKNVSPQQYKVEVTPDEFSSLTIIGRHRRRISAVGPKLPIAKRSVLLGQWLIDKVDSLQASNAAKTSPLKLPSLTSEPSQSSSEPHRITLNVEGNGKKSDGWHCCRCVRNLVEHLLQKRHTDSKEDLDVEKIFERYHYIDMADESDHGKLSPVENYEIQFWQRNRDSATVIRFDGESVKDINGQFLLKMKAQSDVELRKALCGIRNGEGTSLLHLAAGSGDVAMFKWLLKLRVTHFEQETENKYVKRRKFNTDEFSARLLSSFYSEILESADQNAGPFLRVVALELAKVQLLITEGDNYGRSCLHLAVQYGKELMLKYILNLAGIIFDEVYRHYNDPSEIEASESSWRGKVDGCKALFQDRFRTYVLACTNESGETALHTAARYDQCIMIFRLLDYARVDGEQPSTQALTRWDYLLMKNTPVRQQHEDLLNTLNTMSEDICSHKFKKDLGISAPKSSTEKMVGRLHCNVNRPCPCRAHAPFVRCHGATTASDWHARPITNRSGQRSSRNLFMAPSDLKFMMERDLDLNQRVYRDMRDKSGRTALHIAAKLDRHLSSSVLLDLKADPGARDATDKPALYYMVMNTPLVAAEAMDQFCQVDRTKRRTKQFISFLLPTQRQCPELYFYPRDFSEECKNMKFNITENTDYNGLLLRNLSAFAWGSESDNKIERHCAKLMYNRLLLPEHERRRIDSGAISTVGIASCYLKHWWRRLLTADEYQQYWTDYFTSSLGGQEVMVDDSSSPHEEFAEEDTSESEDDHNSIQNIESDRDMLEQIVKWRRMGLVTKPVVVKLVDTIWQLKGLLQNHCEAMMYFVFVLIWTAISLSAYESDRRHYTAARAVLEIIGVLWLIFYILDEFRELYQAKWRGSKIRRHEIMEGMKELEKIPTTSSDFLYTYNKLADTIDEDPYLEYFGNVWNTFDICSYTLLLLSQVFQLANIILDGREPAEEIQFTAVLLLSVGLVFSWLKLLKFLRGWKAMGPFVVMLGHIFRADGDVAKFFVLFVDLLVPFAACFTIIYGGAEEPELQKSYSNFGRSLVSVFRMTLVDLDFVPLRDEHEATSSVVVCFWLFLSGVIFLNLFIAMMSTTFQQVNDASQRFAAMEQTTTIVQGFRTKSTDALRREYEAILWKLDFAGSGEERYKREFYDDPDDEDLTLPNLRIELLGSVSRTHESVYSVYKAVEALKDLSRETIERVETLRREIDEL